MKTWLCYSRPQNCCRSREQAAVKQEANAFKREQKQDSEVPVKREGTCSFPVLQLISIPMKDVHPSQGLGFQWCEGDTQGFSLPSGQEAWRNVLAYNLPKTSAVKRKCRNVSNPCCAKSRLFRHLFMHRRVGSHVISYQQPGYRAVTANGSGTT